MKQYGLFGGSFNPIHNGHLHLAAAVHDALSLERVVLMPTGEAPHKDCSAYASAAHRLAMCRLAAENYPWMQVSDYETRKSGKSYTVETLRALLEADADVRWTLMIGSDMLLSLDTWKAWEEILRMARVCAVSRNDGDQAMLKAKAASLRQSVPEAEIIVLQVEAMPVSSTQIRENLKKNAIPSCLLPKNVVQYIGMNQLYREKDGGTHGE